MFSFQRVIIIHRSSISSSPYPLSISSTSRRVKRVAGAPSTTSWSNTTVRLRIWRGSIRPSTTAGFQVVLPTTRSSEWRVAVIPQPLWPLPNIPTEVIPTVPTIETETSGLLRLAMSNKAMTRSWIMATEVALQKKTRLPSVCSEVPVWTEPSESPGEPPGKFYG